MLVSCFVKLNVEITCNSLVCGNITCLPWFFGKVTGGLLWAAISLFPASEPALLGSTFFLTKSICKRTYIY